MDSTGLMISEFKIRAEESTDFVGVDNAITRAFSKEADSKSKLEECLIVNRLRKSSDYIPELSLVAEMKGEIIGHILFSRANVGMVEVLCLAPLSVDPDFQNKGVGTCLVNEGHRRAKELGYKYSVVLGDPNFYSRFGYEAASKFGIRAPNPIPSKYLQAIKLDKSADALNRTMTYPKVFRI